MREAPTDGWILAGEIDGEPALPLLADVAGMAHGLRIACEMSRAGAERVLVIWSGSAPPPDLSDLAADPRLGAAELRLVTDVPSPGGESVLVARADRIFHRDSIVRVRDAWMAGEAPLAELDGEEQDAVFAASTDLAAELARASRRRGGLASLLAEKRRAGEVAKGETPWLGFCIPTSDERAVRRAEAKLVSSLRKKADGYAARVLNRHVSLFITRRIVRTPITPNMVTVFAFFSALAGGIIIADGSYWAGVLGMTLVEIGSIVDGVDGELARLRCRFSRLGQWMDTVTDDVSNLCYWTGTMISLRAAGVEWAFPLWLAAVCCFVITQSIQYYFIAVVYKSGDLAAIPWAMQSTEFLEQRPTGLIPRLKAGLPKLFKRDFAVTLFLVMALADFLEGVLVIAGGGAIVFFGMMIVQLVRRRPRPTR